MSLISVIIPIYNAERYLDRCFQPLIQMGNSAQIIIVDDGSTDNSLSICKDYAATYSSFSVFHQENQGQSAARNLGLQYANGKYIVFCDADDALYPNAVSEIARITESNEYDIIQFGVESLPYSYKISCTDRETELDNNAKTDYYAKTIGYFNKNNKKLAYLGLVTCKAYKKQLLDNITFKTQIVGEDTLFAAEAITKARSIFLSDKTIYRYWVVAGSFSHRYMPDIVEKTERMLDCLKPICNSLDNELCSEAFYYQVYDKLIWCIDAYAVKSRSGFVESKNRIKKVIQSKAFYDVFKNVKPEPSKRKKAMYWLLRFRMYFCFLFLVRFL